MICITDSLSSALQLSKNLLPMSELNQAQEKTLNTALGFIILCKKFFDINTNRQEIEVLQEWKVPDGEKKELFLAKKKDRLYLYAVFFDSGEKSLGIYINEAELANIKAMSNNEIINYFNDRSN